MEMVAVNIHVMMLIMGLFVDVTPSTSCIQMGKPAWRGKRLLLKFQRATLQQELMWTSGLSDGYSWKHVQLIMVAAIVRVKIHRPEFTAAVLLDSHSSLMGRHAKTLMSANPIMEAVIISVKTLLAVLIAAAEKGLNY